MGLRGRPSHVADASDYEAATALAAKVAEELREAEAKLAALDARLDAAALDDPSGYSKLAAERNATEKNVHRLERAAREAGARADDAAHQLKLAAAQKQISRTIAALQKRDEIGATVMAHARALAESYAKLMDHSEKTRDLLSALVPEAMTRSGFGLHSGEIANALGAEFWRVGLSLPAAQRPVRLDGIPEPYTEHTAPSLVDVLKDGTGFATALLRAERTYDGRQLARREPEPKRSLLDKFPWRKDRAALDEARENPRTTIEALAERAEHDRKTVANALGIQMPVREEGESEAAYLRRVDAMHPAGKLTDEERAALHAPPTGTPRSAAEIQAEINAQGKYSTLIDMRQPKPEEW